MKKMIRKSTVNLSYGNTNKISLVKDFLSRYSDCVNQFIDLLWSINKFSGSFVERNLLDEIKVPLTFSAKQSAAQTALHIVKSQRKKKNKVKPTFKGKSFDLDQRFIEIQEGKNSFDLWIRIRGIGSNSGERKSLLLPTKKHKHFLKYNDWIMKKSIRLRIKDNGKLMADIFFEKELPKPKEEGKIVGLDCGYKKLVVLSNGQYIGTELEQKCEKISKKKQGSKAFKRALVERNEYINREVKQIPFFELKAIIVENLKNVKHKTKGKIARKVMNKLQRWTYPYFLNRLALACETSGVHVYRVNPAYTSQRCWQCGSIHKENRNGEIFLCKECGYTQDADFNASRNILYRFLTGEAFGPCLKNSVEQEIRWL